MLKQSFIYLLLSILVVVFARYAHMLIIYIDMLYAFINVKLTPLFNYGGLNGDARRVLLLVLIPALIAAIPAFIYWLFKRKSLPHFIELTWCVWLVVVLSNVLIRF